MDAIINTELLPSYLVPFVSLSYPTPKPQNPDSFPNSPYYKTGLLDLCLVISCIAIMALLRDGLRLGVFEPFAQWKLTRDLYNRKKLQAAIPNGHANGHVSKKGMPNGNGCGIPSPTLEELQKTAFYFHQVLILNAEAPRKDHVQMMTHHVITIFLMGASYFSNLTRVGCLIMVLMDWCDIFLPLAKMIRYIEISQLACDATFGCFLVSWLVTRHILFLFAIVSTYKDCPRLIPFEWAPEQGRYLSRPTWITFMTALCALQVLQIICDDKED
ncbi:hypothetical protein C0991_006068 [Blastosporella zonata]|nr:hypothetical protein C0991_006068 [Blastosporella zonata]